MSERTETATFCFVATYSLLVVYHRFGRELCFYLQGLSLSCSVIDRRETLLDQEKIVGICNKVSYRVDGHQAIVVYLNCLCLFVCCMCWTLRFFWHISDFSWNRSAVLEGPSS